LSYGQGGMMNCALILSFIVDGRGYAVTR